MIEKWSYVSMFYNIKILDIKEKNIEMTFFTCVWVLYNT